MKNIRKTTEILIGTLIVSGILAFFVFFPMYYKSQQAPSDTYYTKPHLLAHDYYVYIAAIRQGRLGITGMNRYTTDRFPPQYLHLCYEFLGQIAGLIHVSDIEIYYLALGAGLILFVATSIFSIYEFIPRGYRLLAGLFVFFACPLPPWWVTLFGRQIYIGTSSWTKTDIYHRYAMVPHHIMGTSLTMLATLFFLRFIKRRKLTEAYISAFLYFVAAVVFFVPVALHGIALGLSCIAAVAYYGFLVIRKRISLRQVISKVKQNKSLFIGLGVISSTALVTVLCMSQLGPVDTMMGIEYKLTREETFPFLFSILVFSHGILLFLYPFALWRMRRSPAFGDICLLALTVIPWILYAFSSWGIVTVSKLRIIFTSPYVYGGIVATLGAEEIMRNVRKKIRRWMSIVLVILIAGTLVGNIVTYWIGWAKPGVPFTNTYIPKSIMEGIDYVNTHTPPHSRILSTFLTGMYLPALTGAYVYIGHVTLTTAFYDKQAYSESFFHNSLSRDDVRGLLLNNGIDYVFWDLADSSDKYRDFLHEEFHNDRVTIYKVIKDVL